MREAEILGKISALTELERALLESWAVAAWISPEDIEEYVDGKKDIARLLADCDAHHMI